MTQKEKINLKKQYAREEVLKFFAKSKLATRKQILDNVTEIYINRCKTQNVGCINKSEARSCVGTILTELVMSKDLVQTNGIISLKQESKVVVEKSKCRDMLHALLKVKSYKKDEINKYLIKEIGADKTESDIDDQQIRTYVGQILSEEIAEKTLVLKDGYYSYFTTSGIKSYAKVPVEEKQFKNMFLERLHESGGIFFERFLANLLEKYFAMTGRDVLECDVIGGSEDGGIDIVIKTEESLGFREIVVVQAKCRKNILVTETEVRAFYGAMHVANGTRGMYVTTSNFHPSANKLIKSIDNCIGINGDKLFEIAKLTMYGMHQSKRGFVFDDIVFDR